MVEEQLREALPASVRLVVVADHGMVDSPPESRIDVDTVTELRDGLALFGGEARFRQLYCQRGAVDDVVATWRSVLGDRAEVLTREDATALGWFGEVSSAVRPRIGDVVVACRGYERIVLAAAHGEAEEDRDPGFQPRPGCQGCGQDQCQQTQQGTQAGDHPGKVLDNR